MKKASSAKNGGRSLLINWVDWTVIRKVAGVRNAVMMWLVSQRYWAAPASARLTVGVKSCTQVFILRLCSFIRPWMGSLKIGLSQPKSRFTLESKATTDSWGWSFSFSLCYFLSSSRPWRSLLQASHSCHTWIQRYCRMGLNHGLPDCFSWSLWQDISIL